MNILANISEFDFNYLIETFLTLFKRIWWLLNKFSFTYNGVIVYYGWFLLAGIVFVMIINVFWKGARA